MLNKNKGALTRARAQQEYNSARGNLLLVIILTVVNIVFLFAGSGTLMLFSASVPYFSVIFGQAFTWETQNNVFLYASLVFAGVILLAYLLCWIFSKKSSGWMVFALVLFIVDTVVMIALYVWMQEVSGILDAIIHILVLYYLFIGVRRGAQLPTLPPDEEVSPETPETM